MIDSGEVQRSAARPALPQALEDRRAKPETIEWLAERERATAGALKAALTAVESDPGEGPGLPEGPSTRDQLDQRDREVAALRADLEQIRAERLALPVRPIPTYEHRMLLEDALDRTQRRLLIIAPWVRSNVVDQDFHANLQRLCKAGVQVHIGYGIKRHDSEGHDRPALDLLQRLADKFPNFTLRDLGHTHAKILIWDSNMVVTSFNWLSFRGDRHRTYRQEEGTFIGDREYVDGEYERHRSQIEPA